MLMKLRQTRCRPARQGIRILTETLLPGSGGKALGSRRSRTGKLPGVPARPFSADVYQASGWEGVVAGRQPGRHVVRRCAVSVQSQLRRRGSTGGRARQTVSFPFVPIAGQRHYYSPLPAVDSNASRMRTPIQSARLSRSICFHQKKKEKRKKKES